MDTDRHPSSTGYDVASRPNATQRQLQKVDSTNGIKPEPALINELFWDKKYRKGSFFLRKTLEERRAQRLLKLGCPKCRGWSTRPDATLISREIHKAFDL